MNPGADRRRVLLLCGGRSDEHEVSLASAASVLAAAEPPLELVPRVIRRDGRLLSEDASRTALAAGRSVGPDIDVADADADVVHGIAALDGGAIDAVFPLLHGPNGEDGTVQGLLRVAGLPFVGSGVLGSAAAMDKITMKRLFASAGLPQVAWRPAMRAAWRRDPGDVVRTLDDLPWPRFVKPSNLGSSVGIARARNEPEQAAALDAAFEHDRRALVEAAVVGGRELEVAVLGNDAPEASAVGEVRVAGDAFYDYEHKYTAGAADLDVPARLPGGTAEQARALALLAFDLVDAAGLARVDLFLTETGEVLLNEINTLPGFTATSMYPQLWQAAGVSYAELIARLVEFGLEREGEPSGSG
ncbi:MAG: D-alanine--D-alanine ligase [Deinococcus-Thermus bacterium]|jgi:D-alanine-D-alanine ligase|nr:D-alanine--D-alanine ligase [Deinococcota bacterium]